MPLRKENSKLNEENKQTLNEGSKMREKIN